MVLVSLKKNAVAGAKLSQCRALVTEKGSFGLTDWRWEGI